jgi:hypothetical protein
MLLPRSALIRPKKASSDEPITSLPSPNRGEFVISSRSQSPPSRKRPLLSPLVHPRLDVIDTSSLDSCTFRCKEVVSVSWMPSPWAATTSNPASSGTGHWCSPSATGVTRRQGIGRFIRPTPVLVLVALTVQHYWAIRTPYIDAPQFSRIAGASNTRPSRIGYTTNTERRRFRT